MEKPDPQRGGGEAGEGEGEGGEGGGEGERRVSEGVVVGEGSSSSAAREAVDTGAPFEVGA